MNIENIGAVTGLTRSDTTGETQAADRNTGLDMSEFLKLMVAEFQNQSLENQVDSSQYVTQLAQFSSIQAVNAMASSMDRQYAASLVGKIVAVSPAGGTAQSGRVEGVNFYPDGSSRVVVGDTEYELSDVIQVVGDQAGDASEAEPDGTRA